MMDPAARGARDGPGASRGAETLHGIPARRRTGCSDRRLHARRGAGRHPANGMAADARARGGAPSRRSGRLVAVGLVGSPRRQRQRCLRRAGRPAGYPYLARRNPPQNSPRAVTEQQTALYEFVTTTTPGVRFPLIADSWQALVSYDLNTPGEALPIGGYSRSAPTTSPREFLRLIRSHEARYFLLTRDPRPFRDLGAAPVARYVEHNRSLLHAATARHPSPRTAPGFMTAGSCVPPTRADRVRPSGVAHAPDRPPGRNPESTARRPLARSGTPEPTVWQTAFPISTVGNCGHPARESTRHRSGPFLERPLSKLTAPSRTTAAQRCYACARLQLSAVPPAFRHTRET